MGVVGIGVVELVEIDVVGPQPAERALDRVEDVLARGAPVPGPPAHRAGALGGDHDVVAPRPASQRPTISSVRPTVSSPPPTG